jgi:hypothetical protein
MENARCPYNFLPVLRDAIFANGFRFPTWITALDQNLEIAAWQNYWLCFALLQWK